MGDETLDSFAAALRALRRQAGSPSYRSLERAAHFSRTALAQADKGRALPSLPVTLAYVRACGGDPAEWERRWRRVRAAVTAEPTWGRVSPPWPEEPVVDGADPEAASCAREAVTAHARKIAIPGSRRIIGQVELRYSPRDRAAWGRFEGFGYLDHLARERHQVGVVVEVVRESDRRRAEYTDSYAFDYHWSSILRTRGELFRARAVVLLDGVVTAEGETDRVPLA